MSLSIILLVVAGAVLLLAVAFGFLLVRDPGATRRRVEGMFRRAPKAAKAPDRDHYYRPYWS